MRPPLDSSDTAVSLDLRVLGTQSGAWAAEGREGDSDAAAAYYIDDAVSGFMAQPTNVGYSPTSSIVPLALTVGFTPSVGGALSAGGSITITASEAIFDANASPVIMAAAGFAGDCTFSGEISGAHTSLVVTILGAGCELAGGMPGQLVLSGGLAPNPVVGTVVLFDMATSADVSPLVGQVGYTIDSVVSALAVAVVTGDGSAADHHNELPSAMVVTVTPLTAMGAGDVIGLRASADVFSMGGTRTVAVVSQDTACTARD